MSESAGVTNEVSVPVKMGPFTLMTLVMEIGSRISGSILAAVSGLNRSFSVVVSESGTISSTVVVAVVQGRTSFIIVTLSKLLVKNSLLYIS